MKVPRLRLEAVTKAFPGCLANDRVDLKVMPGEIHAILGENGAGKSTLMKIIYGMLRPDAGLLDWEGQHASIDSPAVARKLGIGMVFQHFSLFETLSVAENVALSLSGRQRHDLKALGERIRTVSDHYDLPVDPDRPIYSLSVGERQRVEIVRCLLQEEGLRLLILDEPTSVLTPREVERLFVTLRRLSAEGCSILFISHKLQEVQQLCQHATVLRGGRVVAHCQPGQESTESLAQMMVGEVPVLRRNRRVQDARVLLALRNLSAPASGPFGVALQDMDLNLHAGEIVGIAGVAGNGQKELLEMISGERASMGAGQVWLDGVDVGALGPGQRRRLGLAYVPEERLGKGAVPDLPLTDNALLTAHAQGLLHHGMVRRKRLADWTNDLCRRFQVKQAGNQSLARSLSGGNLQKFILGRELLQNPRVLVAAHPTWGVDVAAAAVIHAALLEMREAGRSVLLVSEDLDELFALCDRVTVISKGRLAPVRPVEATDVTEIGRWMGGQGFAEEPSYAA